MVLKACPPAFNPYLALGAPPPPAFKLYMVLKACPAFNPYLAFRAPPSRFQAIYGVESVPCSALSLKMRVKAPPRSGPQILVKSRSCPPKYCQVDSNVVRKLYYICLRSRPIYL